MKGKKIKTFKIGCDILGFNDYYYVSPQINIKYGYSSRIGCAFCPNMFVKHTGIKLQPGEIGTFKLVRVKQ